MIDDRLSFLDFEADFASPAILRAYDELPLWSAMFGLLLLDEVPLAQVRDALDVGCGSGFPLIELAERLGPDASVHGIDPWLGGMARAAEKIASRRTPNVTLHDGSASSLPFADGSFDLIVSNLGLNNFSDRVTAVRECRRVARDGATLAITTNLAGHMQEFYDIFRDLLAERDDVAAIERLDAHVAHRGTVGSVTDLLVSGGFTIRRVVEREGTMRFASGAALFHHHFIKLGFLDAWKQLVPDDTETIFSRLIDALDDRVKERGELRLTIPMLYVEAKA